MSLHAARRPRRSVPRRLARTLAVRTAVLVVLGSSAAQYVEQAGDPRVDPTATQQSVRAARWEAADARRFAGCVPSHQAPRGQVPSALVVHRFADGTHVRMPFDRAWRLNHDATEVDDVWVIGSCR